MPNPRKLIWFSHFLPFPPRGGAPQRSFNLLRHVARDYEVTFVGFNLHAAQGAKLEECKREFGKFCARVEIWQPPIPWQSPQWWARLALSPALRAPYVCYSLWSPVLAQRWQQILRETEPSLVHVDSIVLGLYFSGQPSRGRVLTHHNCESFMMFRRAELEPNPVARWYLRGQARKFARLEQELCHRFNANVAVSEQDRRQLVAQDPRAHFHVVENGTDTQYLTPIAGAEEPDTLVFAGNLRWYPNVSGLQFFVDRVWPLLKRQRPNLRLCLAGREVTDSFRRWAGRDPAITVVPDPEDIRPWVARGWVFICPILDGGGTRLKILDALAMGKAVVSTTIGCEGLRLTPGENILVADTPDDFAAEVLRVLASAGLRRRLGEAGRALVERQYDWSIISNQLRQAYACALDPHACPELSPARAQGSNPLSANPPPSQAPPAPVRLWDVYRFGYRVALKSLGASRARNSLRMLLEPCTYWRNLEVPAVLNELAVQPGEKVLDVGSPKLPSLYLCYRRGADVLATDLFAYFFEEYSHYLAGLGAPPRGASYRMETSDARSLPYPDNQFDKVYAISVVEHIEDLGDSVALREMARVLKPGGLCSLTVPFDLAYRETSIDYELYYKKPEQGKPLFYQRHYDPEALQVRLIRPSGLSLVRLEYFEEHGFGYERCYDSLNRFFKIPFSLLGPLFSRLFLRRVAHGPSPYARAALLTLRKDGQPSPGKA